MPTHKHEVFKSIKMSNISDIHVFKQFLLTGKHIRYVCLQFEIDLKVSNVTSNFEVLLGVAGFTSVGRPVFISTQSQFLTQNSLQISQIKVSPLDPNGKHLLLKFQAVWLCRLGEIIHQSLISGR